MSKTQARALPSRKSADEGISSYVGAKTIRWRVLLAVTALKVLLIPAYRSTDFEVHRNWLAITSSLPTKDWYTTEHSEWTLDYPPLFAWFEWLLAQAAKLIDPQMLHVENLNYASSSTIYFQRATVILSDLLLASAICYATRRLDRIHRSIVFFLIVAHPGLLIVDHIHFQYNGFLLGILIWSMGLLAEGKDFAAGMLFAVLVNMKHLFATLGPVYFIYLFRHYCRGKIASLNFMKLAAGVTSVFALSFAPFAVQGQLQQVLRRLFPFGRGLCHAYWAANAWALYAALDKVLTAALKFANVSVAQKQASMTGGLVGVTNFTILPDVPPAFSLLAMSLAFLPMLIPLWRSPTPSTFFRAATHVSLASFMLGYHVHEKAALTAVIPAALGAITSRQAAGKYVFVSTISTYALFPLLFTSSEYLLKVVLLLCYNVMAVYLLALCIKPTEGKKSKGATFEGMLSPLEWSYLSSLFCVELYCTWIHPFVLGKELPFLPLMLISTFCAIGMVWVWLQPGSNILRLTKTD